MDSKMQRLKDAADIKEVLTSIGLRFERRGANYFLKCPNPEHHDSNPSCYFKDGWDHVYCATCGRAYQAIDIIMWHNGCNVNDAGRILWEIEGCPSWYMEKDHSVSFTKEELLSIGIHATGKLSFPISCLPYKEDLNPDEVYDQTFIDGYLKKKEKKVRWEDLISQNDFLNLVKRKASEYKNRNLFRKACIIQKSVN